MKMINQHIPCSQLTRLNLQVWQANDGSRLNGMEFAERLATREQCEFPLETVDRSAEGAIMQDGTNTWQRIE